MGNAEEFSHDHGNSHRKAAHGPSSFAMHDSDLVFSALGLKEGDTFLDMGCGPGDYAIQASKIVGNSGAIYAIDKWRYLIHALLTEADCQELRNITAVVSDITQPLPIGDKRVDVCLLATVLHTLNMVENGMAMLREIHRVLKPGGRLAVINCKKEDQPFGPPIQIRWSPEEVEALLTQHGFRKAGFRDLGFTYMIQFVGHKESD